MPTGRLKKKKCLFIPVSSSWGPRPSSCCIWSGWADGASCGHPGYLQRWLCRDHTLMFKDSVAGISSPGLYETLSMPETQASSKAPLSPDATSWLFFCPAVTFGLWLHGVSGSPSRESVSFFLADVGRGRESCLPTSTLDCSRWCSLNTKCYCR